MKKANAVRPRCNFNSKHDIERKWGRYGVLCPAEADEDEDSSERRRL